MVLTSHSSSSFDQLLSSDSTMAHRTRLEAGLRMLSGFRSNVFLFQSFPCYTSSPSDFWLSLTVMVDILLSL
ncbi:unnamed protein product [Cuscuta europaea]|uniref:Uncharacterized protein n=1 Tax=Cuscuta europaea TaxID=41803 RepID=A0A9P1E7W6_CUSEU|nr:unnamed protein product [Cuscuta europaea]